MLIVHDYSHQASSRSLLRRMLVTLVLAVVLSALEVDRRGRIVEPDPIVMKLEYVPRPLLRSRQYKPHYHRAMKRRGGLHRR
jgi:hypothetical protein